MKENYDYQQDNGDYEEIISEKSLLFSFSGYIFLAIAIGLTLFIAYLFFITGFEDDFPVSRLFWLMGLGTITLFLFKGLTVIAPNQAVVATFLGTYMGSMKKSGLQFINPLYSKQKISLRARNLNGQTLKVNDKAGNPIEIAAVIVWQVEDTARASFEVDSYEMFVHIQSEAAVRNLASSYAYDHSEDEQAELTLRDSTGEINNKLEHELNERLSRAGVHVSEARISHLAYSPEIAMAMLQRQQAAAIVSARRQIVDGAVGMVEMALTKLKEDNIAHFDDKEKTQLVSNLLVVLCAENNVTPTVNMNN